MRVVYSFSLGLAIFDKLLAIVLLAVALDLYSEKDSNITYFIQIIMLSLIANLLVAPYVVYDFDNCIPRNMVIKQTTANFLCLISILLNFIPFLAYIVLPRTLKKLYCCRRKIN